MTLPDCDSCPLHEHGRGHDTEYFVPSEIHERAPIVFVGMNPASEEKKQGRPFAPRGGFKKKKNAGFVLATACEDVGLERGRDYSLINIVACTAPKNDFKTYAGPKAVRACAPRLDEDLYRAGAQLIVTLGADALAALLKGVRGKLGTHRGRVRECRWGRLLPTFHPAYFLHSPNDTELQRFYEDLEQAKELHHGPKIRKTRRRDVRVDFRGGIGRLPADCVADVETWVDPGDQRCGQIRLLGYCPVGDGQHQGDSTCRQVEGPQNGSLGGVTHLVCHNTPSDLVHLIRNGWLKRNQLTCVDCTMTMQSLIDENVDAGLANWAMDYGYEDYLGDYHVCVPMWQGKKDPPDDRVRSKNAGDVLLTRDRYHVLRRQLEERPVLLRYYECFLRPALWMATDLELNGLRIGKSVLAERPKLRKRIKYREKKIQEVGGEGNIRSKLYREELLFETLNLPVLMVTDKTKKPALSRAHLEALHDLPTSQEEWDDGEWIPKQLRGRGKHAGEWWDWKRRDFRLLDDLPQMPDPRGAGTLSRYLELSYLWKQVDQLPWLEDAAQRGGYINPRYHIGGTGKFDSESKPVATGRWSASDPSPQVFAPYLKRHIVSRYPDGWIGQWDASQMEVRIALQYSGDPELRAIFERGADPYLDCSAFLFGDDKARTHRFMGKRCLLATIYGTGPRKLEEELNGDLRNRGLEERVDERQCKQLITQLKHRFNVHVRWVEENQQQARELGYVESLTGRRRHLPLARQNNPHALNQAANHPIQSLASDLNLLAAIQLGARFKHGVLITLVHDSGVADLKTLDAVGWFAKKVRWIWKHLDTREYLGFDLTVDLKIEVKAGRNWGEMVEIPEDGDLSLLEQPGETS